MRSGLAISLNIKRRLLEDFDGNSFLFPPDEHHVGFCPFDLVYEEIPGAWSNS